VIERPGAVEDSGSLKCRMTTKPSRRSRLWTARNTTAAASPSMKPAQEPSGAEAAEDKAGIVVAVEVAAIAAIEVAVVGIEVAAGTVVTIDFDQQQPD
jgi:hypothetical protein